MTDLLLHALGGALLFGPVLLHPAWWTALLAGTALGALREVAQPRWQVWKETQVTAQLPDAVSWEIKAAAVGKLPGWLDPRVLRHLREHWANNLLESVSWGIGAGLVAGILQLYTS